MIDLSKITYSKAQENEFLASKIQEFGAIKIPNFISEKLHNRIDLEFNDIFDNSHNIKSINELNYYGKGTPSKAISFKRLDLIMDYNSIIVEIFSDKKMEGIAQQYFSEKISFNDTIYLTYDLPNLKNKPITILHFDRLYALKFYIYLNDTDAQNGAFKFVPKSHHEGKRIRNNFLKQGVKLRNIPLNIAEEEFRNELISMNGKTGDLIIFDTNCFHMGGVISKGERKIIRGHTHIPPFESYYPKLLSKQKMKEVMYSTINKLKSMNGN